SAAKVIESLRGLALSPLEPGQREEHGCRLLLVYRLLEEGSCLAQSAFAQLYLAHRRTHAGSARADLAGEGLLGRDGEQGARRREGAPRGVGVARFLLRGERLERQSHGLAHDARVRMRTRWIDEDCRNGFGHPELLERDGERECALRNRRVEPIAFGRDAEG